jgi:hypothetical protein
LHQAPLAGEGSRPARLRHRRPATSMSRWRRAARPRRVGPLPRRPRDARPRRRDRPDRAVPLIKPPQVGHLQIKCRVPPAGLQLRVHRDAAGAIEERGSVAAVDRSVRIVDAAVGLSSNTTRPRSTSSGNPGSRPSAPSGRPRASPEAAESRPGGFRSPPPCPPDLCKGRISDLNDHADLAWSSVEAKRRRMHAADTHSPFGCCQTKFMRS